ncbi:MAG: DoxX family protein [Bacteroidota bacterium]|nr:DoxX family protein [Bacteroidota bacterium]
MAVLYMAAGINHFRSPDFYYRIMPRYLPYPYELIYISGICESFLGILLFFRPTRSVAAWGIVVLLLAVFPANIQMLVNYIQEHNPRLWVAIIRLPLQLPLIWWAYSFTSARKRSLKTAEPEK